MSHATPTYTLSIIVNFHITIINNTIYIFTFITIRAHCAHTWIKIIRSSGNCPTPDSSTHHPHHHTNHLHPVIASFNFNKSFRSLSVFLSCYVNLLHNPHHQSYFSCTASHTTPLFIYSKASFTSFSHTHITSTPPSPHRHSCHTSELKFCLSLGSLSHNEFVHPLHVFVRRHLPPATPSPVTPQSSFSLRIGMRNTHSLDVDSFEL